MEEAFGKDKVLLFGRHTGLHLLLRLPEGPGEQEMISSAFSEGVKVKGLSEYYMTHPERCADNSVILGYASLRDQDIPALAEALKRAWGN